MLAAFTVAPSLRKHWWPSRTAIMRTPARWHVAMAIVIALATYRLYKTGLISRVPPPKPSVVPRDTWYNSAISHELTRTLRPQDPYVIGELLRYHWFADAHVTATAQLSGTPIINVMITLWLVPALVVLLLVVAAAAQHFMDGPRLTNHDGTMLSDIRRWWVGPVAAFFTMVAPSMWRFGDPSSTRASEGFIESSPSGIWR